MNTIRDNIKDLVKHLLVTKGIASEDQAYEWACGIADHLGLVYHKPVELPVVWIDFDALRREGVDSVEVF